jgi:iron complex outermembrane receptor protein
MKKIALLVLFYFCIWASFAQNLKGKVMNENNEPIPGAVVKLEKTFLTKISNENGEFEFTKLKPGNYEITVSFMGYQTQTIEVLLNSETVSTEILMKISENMTDEVVVNAIRAGKNTPIATTEIDKSELNKTNLGQDVPYLLNLTPSITTSSDAGTGIGYSKLSIRGTDLTRINVTVNGIPLNDAESHGVYWVDLPDLSSSVENIQIQRGVGTSTNGAAAFGANINFSTNQVQKEAYGQLSSSYGSFNSWKSTIKAGTGLINKHFAFDLRLSKIHSDGYIDRASTDMESYYSSASYSDAKTLVKFNILSGNEVTYQSWWGVPKVRLENDSLGMQRYEDHYLYTEEQTTHMVNSDYRTYNYYTYDNQVDNYKQSHYQLFLARELSSALNLNLAFNYTKGKGYYEELKKDEDLEDYGIADMIIVLDTITSTDLIRRKWLDNDLYVVNFSLNYDKGNVKTTLGGSWQNYFGRHYGNIIWSEYSQDLEKNHQWYYNTGDKRDFNVFGKLEYLIAKSLNFFADLQFRKINYTINGIEDNLKDISQKHIFNFFNPKFGLNYKLSDKQNIYASFGVANREPSRTDFKDAINGLMPTHETLKDYEFGYTILSQNSKVNLNMYYMDYTNQLVKTGKINDVGNAIMTNIPDSYRTGVEISSFVKITELINWNFNATLSKNKIKNFTEFVDNWDEGGQNEISQSESNLSFSPEIIIGNQLELNPFKGFQIALQCKYVGKQNIDNTSSEDRQLDAYFVNNLRFSYHVNTKFIKGIDLTFNINNLFNTQYETDAWVYRYFYDNSYYNMDGYFPQAGRNYMAGIVIDF